MSFFFGDNVRKFREKFGLSQEELARRCHLSKDHISKIERGEKQNPGLLTMEAIAKVLGIEMARLLEKIPSKTRTLSLMREVLPVASIPVVGMARAGRGGFFDDAGYPKGQGFQKVSVPQDFLKREPQAYGVKLEGDSMLPSLRPGWIVVAAPHKLPKNGDFVVARLSKGDVMVKEFSQKDRGVVLLKSHNHKHEPMLLHRRDLDFVHRVNFIVPG